MKFRAVILAAGESRRMGAQKLLMRYRGRTMIEYAITAAQAWEPLVVAGEQTAAYLHGRPDVEVVRNTDPQRGMTYSLSLANTATDADTALIVLLADKPLVTPQLIARVCEALADSDVAFPVHPKTREPGHPVVFAPRARSTIAALPAGDSLRSLRDDPALRRREIETEDRGAYADVDTAGALDG